MHYTLQNKRYCSIISLALFSKFQKNYNLSDGTVTTCFIVHKTLLMILSHILAFGLFFLAWIHNSWYQEYLFVIFLYLISAIEFNLGLFEPQVNLLDGTVGSKKCKKWNNQHFLLWNHCYVKWWSFTCWKILKLI